MRETKGKQTFCRYRYYIESTTNFFIYLKKKKDNSNLHVCNGREKFCTQSDKFVVGENKGQIIVQIFLTVAIISVKMLQYS